MYLNNVFNEDCLLLPKSRPTHISFRSFLHAKFEEYLQLIGKILPDGFEIPEFKIKISPARTNTIQRKFIEYLKDTIDLYFQGKPSDAYKKFSEAMDYRTANYKRILTLRTFSVNEDFYRIRLEAGNYNLSPLEMFHIPFQDRGKVPTHRYSIPGFPSLYLSKTLYVAWEETQRPDLDMFYSVRFKNVKEIQVLDLTVTDWGENNLNKHAYRYLTLWPLIACCSIKVQNHNHSFKPEYIIPQLLLQWIREKRNIDGIIYSSTHIDNRKIIPEGEFYNLVLPVKEDKDEGYCKKLLETFEVSHPISKQLMDLTGKGQLVTYTKEEKLKVDNKIPNLELIKGFSIPYSTSVLGQMELELNRMNTSKLE